MSAPTWWVRLGEWFAGLPWWGKLLCGLPVLALIVLGYLAGRRSSPEPVSTGDAVADAASTIGEAISEADNAVSEANAEIGARADARSAEVRAAGGSSAALGDALVGYWRRRRTPAGESDGGADSGG